MKRRLPLLGVAVLLGPALLAPRPACADVRAPAARVEEPLFLLYALGDMYRKSVPKPSRSNDALRHPHQADLAFFLAERRLQFDRLRRHLRTRRKLDESIVTLYGNYERELDLWKEFEGKVSAAVDRYCRTLALGRQAAQQRAFGSGLAYGLLTYYDGASGERALLAGWLKAAQTARDDLPKLNRLQQDARARLNDETNRAWADVGRKIEERRKSDFRTYADEATRLRTLYRWKDAEFAFERKLATESAGTPSRNPFLLVEQAQLTLARKDATQDELVAAARLCQSAADMVPAGAVYNYYRAAFLAVGGLLANRAAAKDLGSTGFVDAIKNPARAGGLALAIWQRYVRNERIDTNVTDGVIHQFILACGYAGKPRTGYLVILGNCTQRGRVLRPGASSNPTFWFDCARVCSLAGDVVLAGQALQQAVRVGFRDKAGAKINPDLQNVRQHRLTAEAFKRLFP